MTSGKQARLLQDVLTEIAAGVLMPGDRLPGVRRLCRRYEAGQRLVTDVLAELTTAGIIERRDRSGCYVLPEAAERATQLQTALAGDVQGPDPLSHYLPRAGGDQLHLLISEVYPELLAVWRDVVADFEACHRPLQVELHTVAGSHPELLLDNSATDVVLATPTVLAEASWPTLHIGDLTAFGVRGADLLPPLATFARQRRLEGVPFSLTLPVVYADPDWPPVDDVVSMLRRVRQEGVGYRTGWLSCLALQAGVLQLNDDGLLDADPGGLSELIELTAGLHRGGGPGTVGDPKADWLAHRIAAFEYYSFFALRVRRRRRGPWSLRPAPLSPGCRSQSMCLLLAINGQSRRLAAAIELVQYLSRPAVQARFAALGGNLPARAAVFEAARADGAWGDAGGALAAGLTRTGLDFQANAALGRMHADFGVLSKRLYAGELPPHEALARANLLIANTNRNLTPALAG